jgi:hypothetical protein
VLRAVALAALVLATPAQAATGQGVALAKALKPGMQSFFKAKGSDYRFTKVTCTLAMTATTGHCKAYFTSASLRLTGWSDVVATINRSTGGVRWHETKRTCKDSKTGAPVVGC